MYVKSKRFNRSPKINFPIRKYTGRPAQVKCMCEKHVMFTKIENNKWRAMSILWQTATNKLMYGKHGFVN